MVGRAVKSQDTTALPHATLSVAVGARREATYVTARRSSCVIGTVVGDSGHSPDGDVAVFHSAFLKRCSSARKMSKIAVRNGDGQKRAVRDALMKQELPKL